jgi:methyl-accepting chemotaxis protein
MAKATNAIDANFSVNETATGLLDGLLQNRIARLEQSRLISIGIALASLALSLGLLFFVARSITRPVARTVTMIQELSKGHLGMRLAMTSRDEIGVMARTMDQFADDLQNSVVATMKQIAAGDLATEVIAKDNQDEIAPALKATTESLRGLVAESKMLTRAAVEGKLATRGDAHKFQGGYREIVQGVNDTLDAVITPLNVAAEYVDRISKGDIPAKITDAYAGDFNGIKHNLNQCIEEINGLVEEMRVVIHATREGNLSQRANPARAQGVYQKILIGQNDILDGVVTPLKESSQILEQVAHGDLTVRMNGNFKGDYATLRDSIETMVKGLKGMAGQSQASAVSMTSATAEILAS